jgi:uncharacterized protein
MELTLDNNPDANVITAVGPAGIRVGTVTLARSFIVSAGALLPEWATADVPSLSIEALAPALELAPEILVLGTGARIEFPDAALFAALAERGIGLEVMDTAAACRTYNVLVAEFRPVVAAIMLP